MFDIGEKFVCSGGLVPDAASNSIIESLKKWRIDEGSELHFGEPKLSKHIAGVRFQYWFTRDLSLRGSHVYEGRNSLSECSSTTNFLYSGLVFGF